MKTHKGPKPNIIPIKNQYEDELKNYTYLGNQSPTGLKKANHAEMLKHLEEKNGPWFCAQPFVNLYVSNYGVPHACSNTSVTIQNHISSIGLKGIVNQPQCSKLRKEMVDPKMPRDQIIKNCERCIETEHSGHVSTRWQSNKPVYDDPEVSVELERLIDITKEDPEGNIPTPNRFHTIRIKSWGNFCNLRCLMCSPEDSSGVAQEIIDLGEMDAETILKRSEERTGVKMPWKPPLIRYSDHAMDEDEFLEVLSKTSRIQLIGGETWLIKQNIQILETAIEKGWASRLTIFCFSNNFGYPNMKYIHHLLSQFKKVVYRCSMELWGEKNNYIRYPSNWEAVKKNIDLIATLPNVDLGVNPTINPINCGYAHEIIEGAAEYGIVPSFMHTSRPQWFNLKCLPDDIKDIHLSRLYSFGDTSNAALQKVIYYVENAEFDESRYYEMIAGIKRRDKHRGDNILKYFPEWTQHFKGDSYYE